MIKEGERMRILVVEDELHLSEALSHILKKNNYTVLVARLPSFDATTTISPEAAVLVTVN